jgi:hypothetical protein
MFLNERLFRVLETSSKIELCIHGEHCILANLCMFWGLLDERAAF